METASAFGRGSMWQLSFVKRLIGSKYIDLPWYRSSSIAAWRSRNFGGLCCRKARPRSISLLPFARLLQVQEHTRRSIPFVQNAVVICLPGWTYLMHFDGTSFSNLVSPGHADATAALQAAERAHDAEQKALGG